MAYIGELAALGAAFFWSISSMVFTEATVRIGSVQLNVNRLIFASLWIMITILLAGIPIAMTGEQIIFLAASGVIGLALGDLFLFKSFQHIGPRFGLLMLAMAPGFAGFLSFLFLGEDLSLMAVVGIAVTLAGIALVILDKKPAKNVRFSLNREGVFFGLLAALGQGGGMVLAKAAFAQGEINGFTASLTRILFSIIILMPIGTYVKRYGNPIRLYLQDRRSLLLTVAGSIVGPYLGMTLSLIAVANTKVGIASTLTSTMPILMLPIARFVYKEKPSLRGIAGAILAVAGVALLFLK